MKEIFLVLLFSKSILALSQNVGIGISNPTKAKLEVHGAVDATSAIFGADGSGISLQRNWPGIGFNTYYNNGHRYLSNGYGALQFLDPGNGYMAIEMFANGIKDGLATSRRAMVFTNDGRVTIGGPQLPTSTLRVQRGTAPDGTAVFDGTQHHSHFNAGPSENTIIRAGKDNGAVIINDIPGSKIVMQGPVGINTSSPDYPLEIRQAGGKGLLLVDPNTFNNWEMRVAPFNGSGYDFRLLFNGNTKGYFKTTDGSYNTFSDRRLKQDIQPLPSLLDKVMKLQPSQYEMVHNNPSHKRSFGFIAQEVKQVFPELVTVMKDTTHGYKGIDDLHTLNYSGFGVIAVKAIQEQQALIEAQAKEIEEQQAEINGLKKKLTALIQNQNKAL